MTGTSTMPTLRQVNYRYLAQRSRLKERLPSKLFSRRSMILRFRAPQAVHDGPLGAISPRYKPGPVIMALLRRAVVVPPRRQRYRRLAL